MTLNPWTHLRLWLSNHFRPALSADDYWSLKLAVVRIADLILELWVGCVLACLDGKVLVTCHQHDRSNNANEAIREIAEQIGRISLHVTIRTLLYVVCIEAERARAHWRWRWFPNHRRFCPATWKQAVVEAWNVLVVMLHTTTGRPHRKGCWSVRACYLAKSWYGRKQTSRAEIMRAYSLSLLLTSLASAAAKKTSIVILGWSVSMLLIFYFYSVWHININNVLLWEQKINCYT